MALRPRPRWLFLRMVPAVLLAVMVATPVNAAGWATKITALTSPVRHGHNATATASTHAGARCSIRVTYKTGVSHAKGLGAKTASSTGRVTWTWKVGLNTTAGKWPVKVTCSWHGVTHSATKYLRVS